MSKSGNYSHITYVADISGNGISGLSSFDTLLMQNEAVTLDSLTPVEITGGPAGYYQISWEVVPGDNTLKLYHASNTFDPSQYNIVATLYDEDDIYARIGSLNAVVPVIFPQSNFAEFPSLTLTDVDWHKEIAIPDYIVGSEQISGWTWSAEARPIWSSTFPLSAAAQLDVDVTWVSGNFIVVEIEKEEIPNSVVPNSYSEIGYYIDVKAVKPDMSEVKPARIELTIRRSAS